MGNLRVCYQIQLIIISNYAGFRYSYVLTQGIGILEITPTESETALLLTTCYAF
jgi:hypothetical protein